MIDKSLVNFKTWWDFAFDVWDTLLSLIAVLHMPIGESIEAILHSFTDAPIDIPIHYTWLEFIATPILIVVLALGVIAFIYRCAKDIINPFS